MSQGKSKRALSSPTGTSASPQKGRKDSDPGSSGTSLKAARKSATLIKDYVRRSIGSITSLDAWQKQSAGSFPKGFHEFTLCIRGLPEGDITTISLGIFTELDLFKPFKLTRPLLTRFIARVEIGYRPNHYHNWHHAVSVAHFIFVLLKRTKLIEHGDLTKLEAFALIVSAFVHDIDHRGTNNQFQAYTNSELQKLYGAKGNVLERHHLNYALRILEKPETNILFSLNSSDHKYFVDLLTHNILATDLHLHLKVRNDLFVHCHAKKKNKTSKMSLLSLIMTAADLSDNCKKWDDNLATVRGLLQEFFAQGDKELELGHTPMNMMNRREAYIPLIEYKFTKYVCAPVFTFLSEHYEGLASAVANIKNNENLWTLSTTVFDNHKYSHINKLDMFDLPDMKEAVLSKTELPDSLDEVKKRTFSAPITLLGEVDVEKVDTSGKRNWFGWLTSWFKN